ncbi:acyl-phosphate glycerol 3-phosphate acyltransferase [Aeromicrobium camelliae]|uniref:Acyl-phosphate glycerol 3-phosphate acyltransferase n=1 Tax=Aeromicrobium camelliae TaxID=1538144 RepID=A0A3N6YG72_9ACTN|nr:1-acyl-sn-glycerol-3-phosphate acyltransferase [Aeromicrobium camelliae]RQN08784.1 acyl-phosphate glycerol 3-phosphate acyltransferase [Aeromicrobium camelliae]
MIRRMLARAYWAVSRWRYRSESVPTEGAGILLGVPHTSNWDFVLMLAIAWREGLQLKFLGKKELFRGPMGPFMRALGGIEVDRANPAGLIDDLTARLASGERFHLVVTPEGTRGKADTWKSGFYRLARATDLPVTLGYVDRSTMTTGLGPTFHLSGDMSADMDRIRAFYAGKVGVRPAHTSVPRLAGESADGDSN